LLAINIFDSHFKKVPYEFFLPLPCLSRKRKTVLQEREEKEKGKKEIGEKKKRNDFRDELKNRGQIFWCHSFSTL
jgi:hypothetical protein